MSNIILKTSIWNYLILNIIGKIWSIFENDTESEHDNMGKFWGKNKLKLLHTQTIKLLVCAVSNMGNARKKCVNIERLPSGDIFALLGSVEHDDEVIENIMNNSDTKFMNMNMNKWSLLISLEKKRSKTKLAPYQFQKLQSTFCLPKTRMKPIL